MTVLIITVGILFIFDKVTSEAKMFRRCFGFETVKTFALATFWESTYNWNRFTQNNVARSMRREVVGKDETQI